MVISKREKTLFIITAVAIIFALLYSFIIEPLYKEYARLNQQIEIKRTQIAKNLKLIDKNNIINDKFKKYGQQFIARDDEEDMVYLLNEIEKNSSSSGVYLSEIKPQKIKYADFYKVVSVEIKFKATIQNLTKFIYSLQNSAVLLKVIYLQLNYRGADSSSLEGTIRINKILFL